MTKPSKPHRCIWSIVGLILLLGLSIVLYVYYTNLQKQLRIAKQNEAAAKDSLHILRTDYGFLAQKYLEIIDKKDSLVKELESKGQELILYQQINNHLALQLEKDTSTVVPIDNKTLQSVFNNSYSDSGITVNLRDSVIFYKPSGSNRWLSENYPFFDIDMRYKQVIYRDKRGFLTASIETFSPYLKTTQLDTKFIDKYIPPPSENAFPSVLALTIGGDTHSAGVGAFVRFGRWGISPKYNFLLTNSPVSWYDRLHVDAYYFIW